MAQCYAESSKPIGGMYGGGASYTGRLYYSVYAGDSLRQFHQPGYAGSGSSTRTANTEHANVIKQHQLQQQNQQQIQQQQQQQSERDRDEHFKSQKQQPASPPPAPAPSSELRKSGEQQLRSQSSTASSASTSSSSSSKSGKNSGEISSSEADSSASSSKSGGRQGNILGGTAAAAAGSRAAYQSWPSSPANFRASPRTRNLSEGSFSMIFPDDSTSASRAGPRSGSPTTKPRSNERAPLGKPGAERAKLPQREAKESVSGRPRSYTGSPPRTGSSGPSSGNIRHTRNSSDGNWSTISSGLRRSNLASTQASKAEKAALPKQLSTGSAGKDAGVNGFVTGGSFARAADKADKPSATPVVAPEVLPSSSYGNIVGCGEQGSTGGNANGHFNGNGNIDHHHHFHHAKQPACKKGPTESYGTGNVYLMGESMLLKKALSSKDPEEVKNIGNEQYKKNHFAEALSLYDRAIMLSPGQAPYHGNKGAALIALGRLVEAVHECQEAVMLDPGYSRAHQRLGALFIRLGRVEDAKRHFRAAGPVDAEESRKLEKVTVRLSKCYQARSLRDWRTLLRESDGVIDAGADSSVQAYALKAEALLNMNRLTEAETVMSHAKKFASSLAKPKYVIDERMLYFVQAEIDIAQGRFEDALTSAEKAWQNEPNNSEVSEFVKKVRKIWRARIQGNDLFKSGKYFEASAAYGEGLELDPLNAIFYCNRAACRSKLGLWEQSIEDCNSALSIQSDYTKALLRRAQCKAQLERWEDALTDYELLKARLPGDVEIARALFDVQVTIKKSKGEAVAKLRFGGEIEEVYSPDQFKEAITSPGLAVVHFISRWSERCRQITPFIDQLCKRYPSVAFVKVDIENHPFLAKTEQVGTVPTFKVYKNGHKMTEMLGPTQQKLEDAVQHYIL